MPELLQVYQNTANFNDSSWETEDLFISDATYISFIVYCSTTCTMTLNWKINDTSDILVESKIVLANTGTLIYSPVKTRYIQFQVNSFGALPCDLKTSAFFFS